MIAWSTHSQQSSHAITVIFTVIDLKSSKNTKLDFHPKKILYAMPFKSQIRVSYRALTITDHFHLQIKFIFPSFSNQNTTFCCNNQQGQSTVLFKKRLKFHIHLKQLCTGLLNFCCQHFLQVASILVLEAWSKVTAQSLWLDFCRILTRHLWNNSPSPNLFFRKAVSVGSNQIQVP